MIRIEMKIYENEMILLMNTLMESTNVYATGEFSMNREDRLKMYNNILNRQTKLFEVREEKE